MTDHQSIEATYKEMLSDIIFNESDSKEIARIFLFWKGRAGLYSLLKAMGVGPGDEVIIPGFTCVVVANAILYCNATPIYVDIDPNELVAQTKNYEQAISDKTKVIITQNTFGLSRYTDNIHRLAKAHNCWSIEDCTHGFGGTENGVSNGSICDASFFSTQWNKPFSTGLGGIVATKNKQIVSGLKSMENKLEVPSINQKIMLRSLVWVRAIMPNKWLIIARRWYRKLSGVPFFVGSSSAEELTDIRMPSHFLMRMTTFQMKKGIHALQAFKEIQELRKKNARKYHKWLELNTKVRVPDELLDEHGCLLYPILVTDKAKFQALAEMQNIFISDWFCSPIHPVTEGFEKWKLNTNTVPEAVKICEQLVGLPTTNIDINKTITFLQENKELVKNIHK